LELVGATRVLFVEVEMGHRPAKALAANGAGARVRRAILDKGAVIPANARIGWDTAADRRRHHVSDRGITVVSGAPLHHPKKSARAPMAKR
jgi:hypothetical protein